MPKKAKLSRTFKDVFLGALGLTVLSLLVMLSLVFIPVENQEFAEALFNTCAETWKFGFGVLVGLVGGKTM